MKKVTLLGYYGSNLGDILMLKALLQMFRKKGCAVSVISYAKADLPDFFEYCELSPTNFYSLEGLGYWQKMTTFLRAVRDADLVLWGGGTCFMDQEGGSGGLKLMMLARLMGKSIAYGFVGIGSCRRLLTRTVVLLATLLSRMVILRDRRSFEFLNSLLPCFLHRKIMLSKDPFYWLLQDFDAGNVEPGSLVISYRGLESYVSSEHDRDRYLEGMVRAVGMMVAQGSVSTVKIVCADGRVDNKDRDRLAFELASTGVQIQHIPATVSDIVKAICTAETVIAARLHVAMLALVAGRSVAVLNYSPKNLYMLEEFGFSNGCTNYEDLAEGRLFFVQPSRVTPEQAKQYRTTLYNTLENLN